MTVELRSKPDYISAMTLQPDLPHPDADQIALANVLGALSDATRLAIIGALAQDEIKGCLCGQFTDLAAKTAISYHVAKLREAGVVRVTPEGTRRRVRLRRADLDARFPGILDSIIANTKGLEFDGFARDA